MRVFHPSCAGTEDTLEVPVGCSEPEGNASEDDLLNSLAVPIPISRGAISCVW